MTLAAGPSARGATVEIGLLIRLRPTQAPTVQVPTFRLRPQSSRSFLHPYLLKLPVLVHANMMPCSGIAARPRVSVRPSVRPLVHSSEGRLAETVRLVLSPTSCTSCV